MGDTPINLNRVRKAKAKADRVKAADNNRVLHGLSKAERVAAKTMREADTAQIEGHKRQR
jgi:hypothetical protein